MGRPFKYRRTYAHEANLLLKVAKIVGADKHREDDWREGLVDMLTGAAMKLLEKAPDGPEE